MVFCSEPDRTRVLGLDVPGPPTIRLISRVGKWSTMVPRKHAIYVASKETWDR